MHWSTARNPTTKKKEEKVSPYKIFLSSICYTYRKHWKRYMGFELFRQAGLFLALLKKKLDDYEQILWAVFSCLQVFWNTYNLFTTSDPPKIRIPILQIFVSVYWRGDKKTFSLVENIFWTNENVYLSPLQ